MNFFLTKENNYKNPFSLRCLKFDNFYFYHDEEWTIHNNSVYKGVSNNYCRLIFNGEKVIIQHNEQRDFPLWYDNRSCSNFSKLKEYLPADAILEYDGKWHVSYNTPLFDESNKLSKSKALELIKSVLVDNVQRFANSNKLPLLAPDSDGLDTLLTRSVFDWLGIEYKLFNLQNRHTGLQTFLGEDYYGFIQIQDFDTPTCLLSGFYGDEYLLRSPSQTQMLIDDDLVKLFDNTNDSYMKPFFNQIYREKCKTIKKTSKEKVKKIVYNDIQVWHSHRTYVFTPFKDTRLLKLLDCEQELMISQQIYGSISKELIAMFNANLLDKLSTQKNSTEPYWFGP
jgi:hypothetical protein